MKTLLAVSTNRRARRLAALALVAILAGCGGGSASDPTTVNGGIPIVYVKRVNTFRMDPLTAAPGAPGGDLMIRAASSPSAPEYNITLPFTQGVGDASDPEVSYDGKKIVFAMRCPTTNAAQINGAPACTGHWNIWEYDTSAGGISAGTFRQITNSNTYDDVGPAYLPAGKGFVFSSNRQAAEIANQFVDQTQSPTVTHSYQALDEYERETVFNLHTMDANGANIQQISFNQSHDRNPVVRPDGTIMFARWEHVADRNRFTIFTVNPDGTNMFVLYGAHADGNSFLHPRDMDPSGPYAGMISSDLMPLDRTQSGGALMLIDAKNYSDQNTPINATVPTSGGQVQQTSQALNTGIGPSLYGRITTPYPLWDGSNRFLLSYAPCQVSNAGVVVSCSTLSSAELAALSNTNRLLTQAAADPIKDNVPPSYAVYMFNPADQTWLLVAAPPAGYMYTDPMPLQAHAEPTVTPKAAVILPALANNNPPLARLTVASVYDTDLLDNMGLSRLAASDRPAGCTTAVTATTSFAQAMIPQVAPLSILDTRPLVANIGFLKDPAQAAYNCTPLRFVRVIRAIAPPSGATGERFAIGATNFEQNQILGYAVVEPDGSFQINIPANTPVAFSVLDQQGRSFQVHTNWVQARPGEVRSCDGCHSPRKGSPINSGSVLASVPASWLPAMKSANAAGNTMAQTHGAAAALTGNYTDVNNPVYTLSPDMSFTDVWADSSNGGVARPSIQIDYSSLSTLAPTFGVINYPDHVQPIWSATAQRPSGASCTSCHNATDTLLNLLPTIAGTGREQSYESLMIGSPVLDAQGNPVIVIQDGVPVVQTGPALVFASASEQPAIGLARQSRLMEILSGQRLLASAGALAAYPNPPASPDHSAMLTSSEKRLIAEWIDLGSKYYNNPFNSASGAAVTTVTSLDQTVFVNKVYPILMSTCAANCHMARGSGSAVAPGTSFVDNKFVLTGNPGTPGSPGGDYNNTLTMISNTCNPADPANYLLSKPSGIPHPAGATGQTAAVLPVGSANYTIISNWIGSGCP